MTRHLMLAVLVTAFAGTHAPTQDDKGAAWAKKWAEKSKDFTALRDRAKTNVLGSFDKAIARVNQQTGLTAAARTDRRKQLEAARKTFAEKGTFPRDDDFIGIELDYFMKLNKAALPLARLVEEVIEHGSRTKNDAVEKQGLKMRAELEQQMGTVSRLAGGSVWHGELRRGGGSTIPYHLYINKMGEGGLFKGHVEDNPGVAGNWSYDVEGQTRNLAVQYRLSRNLRGNFTAVSVEGIVSGDRLIANLVQTAGKKGKASSGVLVLRRVK